MVTLAKTPFAYPPAGPALTTIDSVLLGVGLAVDDLLDPPQPASIDRTPNSARSRVALANLITADPRWHLAAKEGSSGDETHVAARFEDEIAGVDVKPATAAAGLRAGCLHVLIEIVAEQLLKIGR